MQGRRLAAVAAFTTAGAIALAGGATAQAVEPLCGDALQDAIYATPADGTLTLTAKDCTGHYYVDTDITLVGQDGAGFKGSEGERSLTVFNDVDATIKGVTFKGGDVLAGRAADGTEAGGGLEYVEPPRPARTGAARDSDDGPGDLVVQGSTFSNIVNDGSMNDGEGGGLYAEPEFYDIGETGTVTLTGDTFSGNETRYDGGGAAILPTPGLSLALKRASGDTPDVTVTGTTFDGNTAGTHEYGYASGGGLYISADLSSFWWWGGIDRAGARRADEGPVVEPTVTLTGNDYTNNAVADATPTEGFNWRSGGGGEFDGVAVTSTAERYLANTVGEGDTSAGGGISVQTSEIDLNGDSSGAEFPVQGSFTGTNDAIAGNGVASDGHGAGAYGGSFSSCSSDERAARAVSSECGTTLTFVHTTITANTGGPGARGAGITTYDTDATNVDSSIVWGNTNEPAEALPPRGARQAAASDQDEIETHGGALSVTRTDYCPQDDPPLEFRATPDADGNICEDPKLVAPKPASGLPDVHQTAASPTIDQVAGDDPVTVDYDRPTADPRPIGAKPDMGADEYRPPVVETPTQTPVTPAAPAAPAPQGGVLPQVESSPKCGSKRFFRIVLRKKKGRVYKSAKIWVNGKKVKVTTSKDKRPTTRIDLRKFGYQTIRIRITAKLKNGKTLKGKRVYHPCRPSLDDGVPPKL